MLEIERKFIIPSLPEQIHQYPCRQLEQAYLNTDPVIRIRRQDQEYYLTYKGKGLLSREEYNLPLDRDSYLHLLEKADGYVITKTRYCIPLIHPVFSSDQALMHDSQPDLFLHRLPDASGTDTPSSKVQAALPDALMIELDIFHPPFAPLIMAEVEFTEESLARTFQPPKWFGREVTMDPAFHNSSMSRLGLPPVCI